MPNNTFVSIKSVLYDLSTVLPEQEFDQTLMLEWAHKALRKLNSNAKLASSVCILNVQNHKTVVPPDLKYIVQLAYKTYADISNVDMENLRSSLGIDLTRNANIYNNLPLRAVELLTTRATNWKPLRASTNSFFQSITCPVDIYPDMYFDYTCSHCTEEYQLLPDLSLTTTLREGLILLAYLHYYKDSEGYEMIPDEANIAEAIFHYCLYRYYTVKAIVKEQGAAQERDYHLGRFEILLAKGSANINMPDGDMMENLRNQTTKLIPRSNAYNSFFSKLNSQESEVSFASRFRGINLN